jgi:predicted porin
MRAAWSESNDQGPTNNDRVLVAAGYDYRLSARTQLYGTVALNRVARQPGRAGLEAGIRHLF